MPFTSIFLADFYGSSRHMSQSFVEFRAEPEIIFRNSAHSSRVIYGRDPGSTPGSRFLDWECRRLGHRSECLKPLLRKVMKRRGLKGWNYFRWTRRYSSAHGAYARDRGVESYNFIFSAPRALRVTFFCDFDRSKWILCSEIICRYETQKISFIV